MISHIKNLNNTNNNYDCGRKLRYLNNKQKEKQQSSSNAKGLESHVVGWDKSALARLWQVSVRKSSVLRKDRVTLRERLQGEILSVRSRSNQFTLTQVQQVNEPQLYCSDNFLISHRTSQKDHRQKKKKHVNLKSEKVQKETAETGSPKTLL